MTWSLKYFVIKTTLFINLIIYHIIIFKCVLKTHGKTMKIGRMALLYRFAHYYDKNNILCHPILQSHDENVHIMHNKPFYPILWSILMLRKGKIGELMLYYYTFHKCG